MPGARITLSILQDYFADRRLFMQNAFCEKHSTPMLLHDVAQFDQCSG